MANYGVYVPYEQLKEYLGIPSSQTSDDKLLSNFCIQASRKFDAHCHNRTFYPIKATRYYDATIGQVPNYYAYSIGYNQTTFPNLPQLRYDPAVLQLDDDLLEVTSLTTENGNQTVPASDYVLRTGNDYNFPPYDNIQLKSNGDITVFSNFSGTPQKANAVTGFWGYNEQYDQAWQDSLDTVENNPLSSNATTITVNDVDGADLMGWTPRFMVQQLLKIDDELLYVTGKNITLNTLTVIRGVNGTTAASHLQNTSIYTYQTMPEIVGAMQALATYCYRRKDNVGKESDRGSSAIGVVMMPAKLPADVTDILDTYKRYTKS